MPSTALYYTRSHFIHVHSPAPYVHRLAGDHHKPCSVRHAVHICPLASSCTPLLLFSHPHLFTSLSSPPTLQSISHIRSAHPRLIVRIHPVDPIRILHADIVLPRYPALAFSLLPRRTSLLLAFITSGNYKTNNSQRYSFSSSSPNPS